MESRCVAQDWIARYWGKARAALDSGPKWHPLAYHMLDVAAVAGELLEVRPVSRARLRQIFKSDDTALIPFFSFLAAIHDTGKFARAFQCKVPEFWGEAQLSPRPDFNEANHHDADGWSFWRGPASKSLRAAVWRGDDEPLDRLLVASIAHHGRPIDRCGFDRAQLQREYGGGLRDAEACIREFADLMTCDPINASCVDNEEIARFSHWVAGFVTVADWVGSNQAWFAYRQPNMTAADYWALAKSQAKAAIAAAGLAPTPASSRQSFQALTGRDQPTPLQNWAQTVVLPEGPTLFILEDITGAGKTEAAQMLIHRLMAGGRASGAFWAMPTQATANAMYDRQSQALLALFAPNARPSLALAHGQARFNPRFQDSIMPAGAHETPYGTDDTDIPASAACAAFLAEDRRLCLLADVGAGTIDQAVLGVLPSKFNTVRLFGLADKVLIIDEAHAYDAFVGTELKRLLAFQAGLGGSAIVLSATLTLKDRTEIVREWCQAVGGQVALSSKDVPRQYPLASLAAPDGFTTAPIEADPRRVRSLAIDLVTSADEVLVHLKRTLNAGGAAAWVRNTVDDVLAAAAMAQAAGIEPIVFHARFAQADRQAIENRVLDLFGPTSKAADRAGKLVIATQVIEQSLDLDFDQLASDLAPIDLIIQRAGRMRRHARTDRPQDASEALLVLSPDPGANADANWLKRLLPGAAAVYAHAGVMWRTARELAAWRKLLTPDDVRDLVEAVYAGTECPPDLEMAARRAEGTEMARGAQAFFNLLDLDTGYDRVGLHWGDERKVQTRDADPQTTMRLARIAENGALVPWAQGHRPEWKNWALSEVRVAAFRVPQDAHAPDTHRALVEAAREKWGRFEKDIPVCVLSEDQPSEWQGELLCNKRGLIQLIYSSYCGLRFGASER